MKIAGIDFPRPLLDALRDNQLVVFAGAGVSMGEPASLPNFSNLAEAIARDTGVVKCKRETEDQFLGRLHHRGVRVHSRTAQELLKHDPRPTALHRDLLQLFPERETTRIVTTNFDLLFEKAEDGAVESGSDIYTAPALPLGSNFNGIVHIHGSLKRVDDMVLTDSDFGQAYLTEGWALRFLVDLFRSYTVLFVGYSHDDVVMKYLARALPTDTDRYALTGTSAVGQWQILGISPILYPQSSYVDHDSLYDGINGLASYINKGILDWQREITELARNTPPLADEASDTVHDALSDPTRVRFFTSAATHPEWIGWLERSGHLDNLLNTGSQDLTEPEKILAKWLAETFARGSAVELIDLLARHSLNIHRALWFELGRTIGFGQDQPLEPTVLDRWVSILLQAAPPPPWIGPSHFILPSLGERCADANLLDSLLEIFTKMITSRLEIRSLLPYLENQDESLALSFLPSVEPHSSYSELKEFWRLRLQPKLNQVAEPLLAIVGQNITSQHRMLGVWQAASRDWDTTSQGRSAIELHEQDRFPEAIDLVIDVARDCLEYLASQHPRLAVAWCDRLVSSDSPVLRRLAIHTLYERRDLNVDEKIDWLLAKIGLHDLAARHETFRVVRAIYPDASSEKREAVINSVFLYEWPITEDGDREQLSSYQHFRWLHWLHESDPNCELIKESLDNLWKQYPSFQPQEHPDIIVHTTHAAYAEPISPWSSTELLSQPAKGWAAALTTFQGQDLGGPDRNGLLRAVEQAAKENFEWGIGLADTLAGSSDWETDLWSPLIRAWSRELDAGQHSQVLRILSNTKLYTIHARPVAGALRTLVIEGATYAGELLTEANEIALDLWKALDRDQPLSRESDWLTRAINHSAGAITEFWLQSLALWQRQQPIQLDSLDAQYYSALSMIVQDDTSAGTLGKAVLASQLGFLLAADEDWTKQFLVPLFECKDSSDHQAAWDGFLYGSLYPEVADSMRHAFLAAVSRMRELFADGDDARHQFVTMYVQMVTYFVDEPLDEWIPKFFEEAEPEDRRRFAWVVGRNLELMEEARQHEWWKLWLKGYWENRLQGIPVPLDAGEVEATLDWLPHLGTLFPEAVEQAVRMPSTTLRDNAIIYELSRGDLMSSYPEATAKLLIYVATFESPKWSWGRGKELVDRLVGRGLPSDLESGLAELSARLGLDTQSQ